MTHKILIVTALLVPSLLVMSVRAVEREGRTDSVSEKQTDQQVREREGGLPMAPQQMQQDRQEGAEEGLAAEKAESFDRGERFLVGPRWSLGVYAYNTETGVVITRVIPGSAAWRSGLEPGDRIVTVNGFQVGFVGARMYSLGEELQLRADPRGRVRILAQNVRDDSLLNIAVQLNSQPRREPPFPQPRERRDFERP